MSHLHHPSLSEAERELITRFASRIRVMRTTIVPIRDILGPDRQSSLEAMHNLIKRGWLLTNTTVYFNDDNQCVLCGEGLVLARHIADQPDTNVGEPEGGTPAALPDAGS